MIFKRMESGLESWTTGLFFLQCFFPVYTALPDSWNIVWTRSQEIETSFTSHTSFPDIIFLLAGRMKTFQYSGSIPFEVHIIWGINYFRSALEPHFCVHYGMHPSLGYNGQWLHCKAGNQRTSLFHKAPRIVEMYWNTRIENKWCFDPNIKYTYYDTLIIIIVTSLLKLMNTYFEPQN